MKTRGEYGAAYFNSERRFILKIFFCEYDRKEKFIDAEDCVSIDIMMATNITKTDVKKRQGDVQRRLSRDQLQRDGEGRGHWQGHDSKHQEARRGFLKHLKVVKVLRPVVICQGKYVRLWQPVFRRRSRMCWLSRPH